MLSLDKRDHPYQNTRSCPRKPAKNFLALNKMSVTGQKAVSRKSNMRINRRVEPSPQTSGQSVQQGDSQGSKGGNEYGSSLEREETVTISKNYLEQLMRDSFMQDKLRHAGHDANERGHGGQGENDLGPTRKHLDLSPSDIPGLRGNRRREPPSCSVPRQESHDFHTASELTSQHQWLSLLAAQVEENRRLWESQRPQRDFIPRDDGSRPVAAETVTVETAAEGTYHRGTSNRPTHPSMKSNIANIVFGNGGTMDMVQHPSNSSGREVSRRQWLEELTDQIERKKQTMEALSPETTRQPGTNYATASTSPKFARGTALHVDDYARMEMEARKRREMEHQEYLLAQIAEKKRKKEQERLRKEREEREEEERFLREKERAAREYEKEKELQRRKEEQAAKKLLLIQRRTQLAEESALRAREEAKLSKLKHSPSRKPDTVTSEQELGLRKPSPGDEARGNVCNEVSAHFPSCRQQYDPDCDDLHQLASVPGISIASHLRTPSLLQVGGGPTSPQKQPSNPDGHHKKHAGRVRRAAHATGSQFSLHSTSSEEVAAQGKRRREGRSKATGQRSNGIRTVATSRIPISNKNTAKRLVNFHDQGSDSESTNHRHPSERRYRAQQPPNSVARRNGNKATARDHLKRSSRSGRILPGVYAQDKGYAHQQYTSTEEEVTGAVPPPRSPPVPAVAKRLAQAREKSGWAGERQVALTSYDHPRSTPSGKGMNHYPVDLPPESAATLPPRTRSPPLPVVAQKLLPSQQGIDSEKEHAGFDEPTHHSGEVQRYSIPVAIQPSKSNPIKATSPSLPAIKGRHKDSSSPTFQEHPCQLVTEVMPFPVFGLSQRLPDGRPGSPPLFAGGIRRSASISPIDQPLSPARANDITLSGSGRMQSFPPVHDIRSAEMSLSRGHRLDSFGAQHHRQRQILEQLSRLKQAILAKQRDVDLRSSTITTGYKRVL